MADPETVDQVRGRARASYAEQIALIPWLQGPDRAEDRAELERVFTGFLAHWDAWIHDARLRGVPAGKVQATGVIALSNMLAGLVNNTTRQDRSAREAAQRRLHKLILENLKRGP